MLRAVTSRSPTVLAAVAILTTAIAPLPAQAALPAAPPLTVTTTVDASKAPWPGATLVLAWLDRDGGRLYPLPLLDRHGVLLDKRAGRRVAATWSPKTGTAALLSLPGDLKVTPSEGGTKGWRAVRDPVTNSLWLPGKPLAIDGPSERQLDPIPETATMPLRLARRVAPKARVVTSNAPPAALNSAWQDTRHRDLIPTLKSRLTVVLATEHAVAWRYGALPMRGLARADIGILPALVVRAHGVTRAFMAPMTPTMIVAHDPWTGAPWLWTEGLGLWNGLTGRRLNDGQAATQALTVIELSEPAFRVHWPGGAIHGD